MFENQNHSHVFVKGFSVVTPNQEILGQWTLCDVNILKDMTEKKKDEEAIDFSHAIYEPVP